ncbi:outer membrane protein assembly factor BamB family protein [Galbibacter mesophilus]|uniref:outer membrane protein assembly factor BamB family protein n=1 Tax=Galbibacter mesophilus TaxID=379069 RepID=UPI00191E0CF5|nr:PQQ-binding-like beta-propeller repeat protein [Galbibacter mesophilus]MCM5662804.1 PQQ-binding-like beta-propeller repeat protein [Galbibacter mesophilus]
MRFIQIVLFLFLISCSKDEDTVTVVEQEGPPATNLVPSNFSIIDIVFDGKVATIDWEDAIDGDTDEVYYKLYVDNALIDEYTQSIATVELQYNSSYNVRIIATDRNGGTVETNKEIDSPNSKILFFQESNGITNALDLYTRKPLWKKKGFAAETFSVYQNVIYSTVNNGFEGLDILTGETIFTPNLPSLNNKSTHHILVDDMNIYALAVDADMHCVNRITGEELWEVSLFSYHAPPAMDESRVFVSSRNNGHIKAVNKLTGNVDWRREVDFSNGSVAPRIYTNPLISGEDIYYGDNLGRFYSVNKNTGEKNWTVNGFNSFSPSPASYEENIIVGTYNDLFSYKKSNGNRNWIYRSSGSFQSSPFVNDGKVYIGVSKTIGGELVCLNADTGKLIWQFELGSVTTTSPVVYNNIVYMGDWSNKVYAINADTGVLEWTINTDESVMQSFTIVIGNGDNVIYPSSHGLSN